MYNRIIDNINETIKTSENAVLGEDGLLYCPICKKPLETKINVFNRERIVRCICDCKKKELEAETNRDKWIEKERNRRICFQDPNMHEWTFANDDRKNAIVSDAMQNYVSNFSDFRKDGKGLMLYGSVGTGKSFLAACVANALIDKGYTVRMEKLVNLVKQMSGAYGKEYEFINGLNKYDFFVFDDLGVERNTEFMQEQVANIIDGRYCSGKPFIVTTNFTMEEFKKPKDMEHARMYDRILERCFPIEMTGPSRRRQAVRKSFEETKSKLGL